MTLQLRIARRDEVSSYLRSGLSSLAEQLSRAHDIGFEEAMSMATQSFASIFPEGDLRDGIQLCIVEEDGQHVGLTLFGLQHDSPVPSYYVWDILIEPHARGHGYGIATMRAIEEHALHCGIDRIALNVFATNTAARALYAQLGYQEVGVRMLKRLRRPST